MQSLLYRNIALVVKKYRENFCESYEVNAENFDYELFIKLINEFGIGIKCTVSSASFWQQVHLDLNENTMTGEPDLYLNFHLSCGEEEITKNVYLTVRMNKPGKFHLLTILFTFHVFSTMSKLSDS